MLFLIVRVYENIIEINNAIDVEYLAHDLIDVDLKDDRCIAEFKEHYQILEVIVARAKDRLSFVVSSNSNSMIDISKIQLDENTDIAETIHKLVNTRKRITILDRDFVQFSVVHAQSQTVIRLSHKEYRDSR